MSAPTKPIVTVEGTGIAVRGDDIDTDRIIPARFLRCVTFDGLGEHAFEDDRAESKGEHPFDKAEFREASVLVANSNFGCGSSREHAPQSLQRRGIQGIVGESFAEIFFGNCIALGLPCLTLPPEAAEELQSAIEADPKLRIRMDVDRRTVEYGDRVLEAGLPDGAREAFLSGAWDSTSTLLERPDEIDAVGARLPYVAGW